MTITDFKEELKGIIRESGMSVCEISKKSGVATQTIYDWLNKDKTPSLDSAQWVLNAIGYNISLEG